MRGRQGANVATIAKNNGGGGHVGAAAFTSDKSLQEIEQLILTSFRKELLNNPIINEKVF